MTGVEVTQADREALCQDILLSIPAYMHKSIFAAFAHHRHEAHSAALEGAAKVADTWAAGDYDESSVTTAIHIAGDIRSLSRSGGA
ncbi:hypothetical protein [Novosphingobium clariflavum]|uniref:Uncharacterized protein n=1 Tax=Novosphingobium clariflavum TaxID=2029884 RepID=A0ABV6SA06_9SPHN|nr:hypothetical protein [Novosphingobium clariflavum]